MRSLPPSRSGCEPHFRFDKTGFWLLNATGLNTNPTDPSRSLGRGGLLVASTLALLGLTACTFWNGPRFEAAAALGDLPSRWTAGGGIPAESVTGWLDDFGSPTLRSIVEEAVGRNYSLASARSRVGQALERARIAGADRLPAIDAALSTSRSQNLRGSEFANTRANNFNFGLDLSWEIDLWGRLKNLRDAETRVRIDFLVAGQFPGDGKPGPVAFPEPAALSTVNTDDGIAFLPLATLVQLKLASGRTTARLRDLADVQELIRILDLPLDFATNLDPALRDLYQQMWREVDSGRGELD